MGYPFYDTWIVNAEALGPGRTLEEHFQEMVDYHTRRIDVAPENASNCPGPHTFGIATLGCMTLALSFPPAFQPAHLPGGVVLPRLAVRQRVAPLGVPLFPHRVPRTGRAGGSTAPVSANGNVSVFDRPGPMAFHVQHTTDHRFGQEAVACI